MMPLAQNSREGEQGRLSPQDDEEEEEVELTEVESSDASPADCFAYISASWCDFPCPPICFRVYLFFLIVVGIGRFHLLLTALNG